MWCANLAVTAATLLELSHTLHLLSCEELMHTQRQRALRPHGFIFMSLHSWSEQDRWFFLSPETLKYVEMNRLRTLTTDWLTGHLCSDVLKAFSKTQKSCLLLRVPNVSISGCFFYFGWMCSTVLSLYRLSLLVTYKKFLLCIYWQCCRLTRVFGGMQCWGV